MKFETEEQAEIAAENKFNEILQQVPGNSDFCYLFWERFFDLVTERLDQIDWKEDLE